MGLMDVLNGMQNGPRGQTTPGQGGMSPLTMALLGLLAFKAIKSVTGSQQGAPAGGTSAPGGGGLAGGLPGGLAGGLGGLLQGGLGSLLGGGSAGSALGGGSAGSVLSGGLNDLLKQLEQGGQGDVAKSWVGTGPNKTIAPDDLANALGGDRINQLMQVSGMSRDDLLNGLSQHLPGVVDQLTPGGRVPTDQEAEQLAAG
jgi:uncharacterized protein YidB (DUF937 family)